MTPRTVAALYVDPQGVYGGIPGVECWGEVRDARTYAGPHPVVAHPPCQRWGRFWHGSPRKPHQFKLGDDGGCFEAAIGSLDRWGGVLEHPADSKAWDRFGFNKPAREEGWRRAGFPGWWTCYVEQGQYGHTSRKGTWLLLNNRWNMPDRLPKLDWSIGAQRLDPKMVERHGYEYARRKGVVSMIGGKNKTTIRNATPPEFRDVLLAIARSVTP